MKFSEIFFDDKNILRSGWRFLGHLFALMFFGAFFSMIAGLILQHFDLVGQTVSLAVLVANGIVLILTGLAAGWFCGRIFEKVGLKELGAWLYLKTPLHIALGLFAGAAAVTLAIGIAYIFGGIDLVRHPDHARNAVLITMATSAIFFAFAAAGEEFVFRGYMLQTFVRSDLTWVGILITSLLFATVHNANPGATLFSWTNTFIAGIWFAVAYLKTRELWFVSAMHFMWNWMQGSFYGIEVSGLKELIPASYLMEQDHGPNWLTGGEYGIEGGAAATIALIISTLVIYYFPDLLKTSQKSVPPA